MDFSTFDRINIGCGHSPMPGYLNVDVDERCKPDYLLRDEDFSGLPKRHFVEVHASDVLEHIPRGQTVAALLEWAALLKVGGRLRLQTSNVEGIGKLFRQKVSFERHHTFTIFMYGNQMHPGDWHYTGFTDVTLKTYLLCAGFVLDSFTEKDDWLFDVTATLTKDWTTLLDQPLSDEAFLVSATDHALLRAPQQEWWSVHLEAVKSSRRNLLKQFYASHERALRIAALNGF